MLFEMETLDFLGNMLTCFHYKSNSLLTSANYAQVEQNISEAQMEVSRRENAVKDKTDQIKAAKRKIQLEVQLVAQYMSKTMDLPQLVKNKTHILGVIASN